MQKEMYPGIDSVVNVYAPQKPELQAHLSLIKQYNERKENPAHWTEKVYAGDDFFEKMIAEKKGDVAVIAGDNLCKTAYIKKSIDAGINVLADKPMAINYKDFTLLKQTFAAADKKKLLLYDIMTERYEVTNTLQKALAAMPAVFGQLQKGSKSDPAVVLESVHFLYKYVSGNALTRPDWFFDPLQQGEAITDVGTHLIDLVQWECFPEQIIDYKKDIHINSARTWTTPVSLAQFTVLTKKEAFPDFLIKYVKDDTVLQTHTNGEISYTLKNIHIKVTAKWNYKAYDGSGDTHYALLKGTKASLELRQGKEEHFQPVLYIIPAGGEDQKQFTEILKKALEKINTNYPGITVEQSDGRWKVIIPQSYKTGHESHFGQVMQKYLQFLKQKKLPRWEEPGMIAKYYTLAKALEMAKKEP